MEIETLDELPIFQPVDPGFPNLKLVCTSPLIYSIGNFLDASKCQQLINQTEPFMFPAPVVGKGNGEVSKARTASSCFLNREDLPTVVSAVSRLLAGKSVSHIELPQVGRYRANEEYQAHFDAFDLETEDGSRFAENGGQRVATVLIYLNDVMKGGRTYFPSPDLSFQPVRGDALVFFPASLDGKLDDKALHGNFRLHNKIL